MTNNKQTAPVAKNDVLEGEIIDLTHEGLGIVKLGGYPLFIEGALINETVEFKVIKVGKNFGVAKLIKIIKESPDRVEVTDRAYAQTGTMPLQHLTYEAQLTFKKNQVENVLTKIGKLPDVKVNDVIGMDNPFGYRNKAQIPVRKIKDKLETGVFRKNSHDLIPMEDFKIQDPEIDKAVVAVRDIMRKYSVKPYNEKDNTGNLRHILVRRGYHTGEMMITLVTRTPKLFPHSKIVPDILEALPEVVSIIQNVNPKKTNVILGQEVIVLHGEDKYQDKLLNHTFEISHRSFFQVNTAQAEILYSKVLDFAELTGEETVIDAYCGIGTITLALAEKAKQVYGIELIEPAVLDARRNAELNGIENVTYQVGAAEDVMLDWSKEGREADLLVVDPPRKGLEGQFIDAVIKMQPKKMVYVSCNPSTLARDLALLVEGGYTVKTVQPVDMFPQTSHVETIVELVLKGTAG
ncbi:23S rRNA (uracil(1939)-C(5))-methyltransferase RlmD [Alkalibacterium olivapovliticus]|uniref:23S rRNA (Uracil1939-C5)-methyltransferase n=1 Tax=Alkalibacterium olivapovliticus TaxID=99907 RepID=A0A2T0W830_9LACT|nr:23S rRNA (uracil(1939)-C(5))-methyltransferase RlmD [Alkalibacterium olivapovliticus]PRY82881.1 23S rRNA (uracil1939-C5)-methyltransferase [Alkalibacterium olivapovliticus]